MARKPLSEKTVAQNVLKWGTGGINIDGSRVETYDKLQVLHNETGEKDLMGNMKGKDATGRKIEFVDSGLGRFPANLIHDNSEEVRECFPETKKGSVSGYNWEESGQGNVPITKNIKSGVHFGDSGNASRFFKSIKKPYTYKGKEYKVDGFVKNCKPQAPSNYNDDGSPARYFKSIIYQAKSSKRERNAGCEELYILKDNTPQEDIDEIKNLLSI